MKVEIEEGTNFPALFELVPTNKLQYSEFAKMLVDTGAKHEDLTVTKMGNVLKVMVRVYSKEQAESFLPLFFSVAHEGVTSVEISGKQCFKRLPSFVYFVESDGTVSIV